MLPGKLFIALTLTLIVARTPSWGTHTYVLPAEIESPVELKRFCWLYPDSTGVLSIDQIVRAWPAYYALEDFPSLDHQVTYWMKLQLKNNGVTDKELVLTLGENNFAHLYSFTDSLVAHHVTGELVRATQKKLPAGRKECAFPVTAYARQVTTFYVRVYNQTHFPPELNPRLHNEKKWFADQQRENVFQAFFQGILFLLIVYSLSIFIMYPQWVYAYFALFVFTISVYFLWFKGLLHEIILPNHPHFTIYVWLIAGLAPVFYIQFARQFLDTSKLLPRWDKVLVWMIRVGYGVFVLCVVLFVVTFNRPFVVAIANNFILANLIIGLFFLYSLFRTKSKLALFFILGSVTFAIGSITGLVLYQYFQFSQGTYFVQAGNVAELLCFSIGLGYRINLLQKNKVETDRRLIEELQKNEALQKRINQELGKTIDHKDQQLELKNEELLKLVENLQAANSDLRTFAYSISHDLKTPLRAISSMATFIEQDQGDKMDAKTKGYLNILQDRVKKMEKLFDGILEYSKLTTSKQEIAPVDLTSTLAAVKGVIDVPSHIDLVVPKNLPAVKVQPTKIHQVFQNLIVNAIKFMDKEVGRIEVGFKEKDKTWQFFVKDNGRGIEPSNTKRIFLIFKTGGSTSDHGAGVGLSIVKKSIEQHGGEVWVESTLGEGSTFYFTLPK